MSDFSKIDDSERMSMRNSLLVWVSGAVLGWVVAVIAIYSVIRTGEEQSIAEDETRRPAIAREAPADLDDIAPAAGETKPKTQPR